MRCAYRAAPLTSGGWHTDAGSAEASSPAAHREVDGWMHAGTSIGFTRPKAVNSRAHLLASISGTTTFDAEVTCAASTRLSDRACRFCVIEWHPHSSVNPATSPTTSRSTHLQRKCAATPGSRSGESAAEVPDVSATKRPLAPPASSSRSTNISQRSDRGAHLGGHDLAQGLLDDRTRTVD